MPGTADFFFIYAWPGFRISQFLQTCESDAANYALLFCAQMHVALRDRQYIAHVQILNQHCAQNHAALSDQKVIELAKICAFGKVIQNGKSVANKITFTQYRVTCHFQCIVNRVHGLLGLRFRSTLRHVSWRCCTHFIKYTSREATSLFTRSNPLTPTQFLFVRLFGVDSPLCLRCAHSSTSKIHSRSADCSLSSILAQTAARRTLITRRGGATP